MSKTGDEFGRAHRASLRVGNHAEYTLIERVLHDKNLEGSTLYVTLEPCVSRNPPKKGCAEWIVQARVGQVVVGMIDPNPDVNGGGIAYLDANKVGIHFFERDLKERIEAENKGYIDYWKAQARSPKEPPQEFPGPSSEENIEVTHTSLDDLSYEVIEEYVSARKLSLQVPSAPLWEFFKKAGFLVDRPQKDHPIPTLACLVLFGKTPDVFLPQCKIKADRLRGSLANGAASEMVVGDGQRDITGPLSRMVLDAVSFFNEHVSKVPRIQGATREQVPEYPDRVIREAIVNALVHRNYQGGMRVVFRMFRDRIVVKSPGYAPPPLTLARIQSYEEVSIRRNPRIADTAAHLNLMEEKGTGLRKMRDVLKEHGLREPEFRYEDGYFVVTLFGRELTPISVQLRPKIREQLTERQEALLKFLEERGKVSSKIYTRDFGIARETATQDFKKLMNMGLIERKGKGKNIHYVLKRF